MRCHDLATAAGSLAAQQFVPDDHAEPLPDGLRLLCSEWGVADDLAVCEQLGDSPQAVDLGLEIGAGDDVWAYAWLAAAEPATVDLGGWREDPAQVEVARLLVYPNRLQALSASPAVLAEVRRWVETSLEGLTPTLFQAA